MVRVWDLGTAKEAACAEVGDIRIGWLTFLPDRKHILVAGSEHVFGINGPPGRKWCSVTLAEGANSGGDAQSEVSCPDTSCIHDDAG